MKHVCVAARIGDGKALVAANVQNLRKTSNAASADSGCNPSGWHEFWLSGPRLSASAARGRRRGSRGVRRICHSGGMGAVPASGPAANESRRLLVARHLLRMTKRRALLRVLSQNRDSARAFHYVTHSKWGKVIKDAGIKAG